MEREREIERWRDGEMERWKEERERVTVCVYV